MRKSQMQESSEAAQVGREVNPRLIEGGARVLAPDLLVTPHGAEASRCLIIGKGGTILALLAQQDALPLGLPLEHLPRRALLAGFVNAHSHVFQRRLRGRTHRGYADHDSFWTWREQMYREANAVNPESLYATALACYREMLGAGYTAVGEF